MKIVFMMIVVMCRARRLARDTRCAPADASCCVPWYEIKSGSLPARKGKKVRDARPAPTEATGAKTGTKPQPSMGRLTLATTPRPAPCARSRVRSKPRSPGGRNARSRARSSVAGRVWPVACAEGRPCRLRSWWSRGQAHLAGDFAPATRVTHAGRIVRAPPARSLGGGTDRLSRVAPRRAAALLLGPHLRLPPVVFQARFKARHISAVFGLRPMRAVPRLSRGGATSPPRLQARLFRRSTPRNRRSRSHVVPDKIPVRRNCFCAANSFALKVDREQFAARRRWPSCK